LIKFRGKLLTEIAFKRSWVRFSMGLPLPSISVFGNGKYPLLAVVSTDSCLTRLMKYSSINCPQFAHRKRYKKRVEKIL